MLKNVKSETQIKNNRITKKKLMKTTLLILIAFFVLFSSCKKENDVVPQVQTPITIDSMYMYDVVGHWQLIECTCDFADSIIIGYEHVDGFKELKKIAYIYYHYDSVTYPLPYDTLYWNASHSSTSVWGRLNFFHKYTSNGVTITDYSYELQFYIYNDSIIGKKVLRTSWGDYFKK